MGQQVRSVSKSDLWKKKSIHEASQLPVFAPLLHKRSVCANPQSHTVSLQFVDLEISSQVQGVRVFLYYH